MYTIHWPIIAISWDSKFSSKIGPGRLPWGLESIGARKRGYLGAMEGGKKPQPRRNSSILARIEEARNRRRVAKWAKIRYLLLKWPLFAPLRSWEHRREKRGKFGSHGGGKKAQSRRNSSLIVEIQVLNSRWWVNGESERKLFSPFWTAPHLSEHVKSVREGWGKG